MTILIDNGHGSDTPGKRSPDGLFREYSYTRKIASRVVSELSDCGYDARLLVPEIEDIPLTERCRRVNAICDEVGMINVILYAQAGMPYIGVSATTYYINGSDGRACAISNWMCDITRRIGDADVAFLNRGGVRTTFPLDGKKRRDITVSDIYEMFPFSNNIYVYRITYGDLLQLFEYSLTESGGALFTYMTGINCRFNGQNVISLEQNGRVIYEKGRWNGDWKSRSLTLAVSEYIATSAFIDNRTHLVNPLIEWNKTSRLLSNSQVDNENAILVLREESALWDGHLYIDTVAHFLAY